MAQFSTVEQVSKYFEYTNSNHFKIYASVKDNLTGLPPVFQFKETNNKKALVKLNEVLELLISGGDASQSYTLHCFDSEEDSEKTSNKKTVCTFQFKDNEQKAASVSGVDNSKSLEKVSELYDKMLAEKDNEKAELKKSLDELKFKVEELEAEEEEEPAQTPTEQLIGAVAPALIQLIPSLAAGLVSSMQNKNANANNRVNVNGIVNDNSEALEIINELRAYVPNIEEKLLKLLSMAKENPTQFNTLLNFL